MTGPLPTPRPSQLLAGAAAGVVLHNGLSVLRLRRIADRHDHRLVHDAVVGVRPGPPAHLAVLGDSAPAGMGLTDPASAYPHQLATRLADALARPVRLTCLARRGAGTRDVTAEQVPRLAGLRPDMVVISVGANDALGRRRPRQVRADTVALLAAVRAAAPDAAMLLGGAPDLGHAPGLPRPLRGLVGVACRAVARAQASAAADLRVPFGLLPPQPPDSFGPDSFHGGPATHARAAELTVAALLSSSALATRVVDGSSVTPPADGGPG
ncbi:MAG TPA: GDSL-type esterase/lipase family protein [Nitriliruptorales bacterium]|nr:GDSL-type esterase/lipase family protein [Nitriliruptorales bacterium]